jgi:putative sigma-54 modulation protein
MMQFNLTGKNQLEITPAIKQHADDKFNQLNKHFRDITNAHLVLHIEHHDHCAEGTLHFHGNEMHATAKSSDMYQAIDQVAEKLSVQMKKHKEKLIDSHRQSS